MSDDECIHEMLRASCSVCTPRHATLARSTRSPEFGPWIEAFYEGRCAGCEGRVHKGDQIRADGAGNWLCGTCGGSGPVDAGLGALW